MSPGWDVSTMDSGLSAAAGVLLSAMLDSLLTAGGGGAWFESPAAPLNVKPFWRSTLGCVATAWLAIGVDGSKLEFPVSLIAGSTPFETGADGVPARYL